MGRIADGSVGSARREFEPATAVDRPAERPAAPRTEDLMRRASPAALAGAILIGVATMTACAAAKSVPVPKPAPQAKNGTSAAAEPPRPPMALSVQPLPDPMPPTAKPLDQVAGPGGNIAFDTKQRSVIEKASGYLTGIQTLVGDFVQVAPNGSRSEGKFFLQKPGKVRFEYDPPSPLELISNGQTVAVRDRKLATQEVLPLSQTPLRFLLAERIDLLKETNVVGAYTDDLFVTVVIEERQTIGGTNRLMLMFGAQDFQLRQWTVTDAQGFDTTVAVYNLDKTKKIDQELFKINFERVLQ
jgi:outer membrane lipoprotein-sorting protein